MIRLAVLLLLAAPLARAEEDGDLGTARRHFDAGATFYEQGDFRHALEEFLTAQRLHPVPAFDYNIGRCYDRLDQIDDALQHYERYAGSNPPDADWVKTRIIELRRRVELLRPPPPRPSHKKRNLAIALGVVGGVVVVAVAVGLGVGLSGSTESFSPSTLGPMRVTP